MKFIFSLFVIILIEASCNIQNGQGNKDSLIEIYTIQVEKADKSALERFGSLPIDNKGEVMESIYPIIDSIEKNIRENPVLNDYVDSLFTCDFERRRIYLGLSLHEFLHKNDILDSAVFVRGDLILATRAKIKLQQFEILNSSIAWDNFNTKTIGDTIVISLPVKNNDRGKSVFYYAGYPYSTNYNTADDSVCINALIQNKKIGANPDLGIDSTSISFTLKIISSNDSSISISKNAKSIYGDIFDLYLYQYGRVIQ